jgi:hypothetical protein
MSHGVSTNILAIITDAASARPSAVRNAAALRARHHGTGTNQEPHDISAELIIDMTARYQACTERGNCCTAKGDAEFSRAWCKLTCEQRPKLINPAQRPREMEFRFRKAI